MQASIMASKPPRTGFTRMRIEAFNGDRTSEAFKRLSGASYLPAFQRYCGKSYTQIDSRTWDHYYAHNQDKLCVLIMSGLYGLLEASEWIQEYDIHLTDRVRETGMPLTGLWRDFF